MSGTIKRYRPRVGTMAAAEPRRALLVIDQTKVSPADVATNITQAMDDANGRTRQMQPAALVFPSDGHSNKGAGSAISRMIDRALIVIGTAVVLLSLFGIGAHWGHQSGVQATLSRTINIPDLLTASTADIPHPEARDGGPCDGFEPGTCPEALRTKELVAQSRYYLRRGDAEVALGQQDRARAFYNRSVVIGRPAEASSAALAFSRLQFLGLSCVVDDAAHAPVEITTIHLQRALKSLGHYNGRPTGKPNAALHEAVRQFQAHAWFDETGVLTTEETVMLVCGAAEITRDAHAQTLLGMMYAAGQGVQQDTDKARQWLDEAAIRGSAEANWNLALMIGTGMVETSTPVCGVVQDPARADDYLQQAIDAGHPDAMEAHKQYLSETPAVRWQKIAEAVHGQDDARRGCLPRI